MLLFAEFVLNVVSYGLLVLGAGLWLFGMMPKRAARIVRLPKRTVDRIAAALTIVAAVVVALSVYVPAVARQPYPHSRFITAPLFLIVIVITCVALFRSKTIDSKLVLLALAILALAASIFRLY